MEKKYRRNKKVNLTELQKLSAPKGTILHKYLELFSKALLENNVAPY